MCQSGSRVTSGWLIVHQFSPGRDISSHQGGIFPSAIRLDLLKVDATKGPGKENEGHISPEFHRDTLNEAKSATRDDRDFQAKIY